MFDGNGEALLVQKTNLLLKLAGLNASIISITQLKFTAPVIIVKLFSFLFSNNVARGQINYTPSNRYHHQSNVAIVLKEMQRMHRDDFILQNTTAYSIVDGDMTGIEAVINSLNEEAKSAQQSIVQSPRPYINHDIAHPGGKTGIKWHSDKFSGIRVAVTDRDVKGFYDALKKRSKQNCAEDLINVVQSINFVESNLTPQPPIMLSANIARPSSAPPTRPGRRSQAKNSQPMSSTHARTHSPPVVARVGSPAHRPFSSPGSPPPPLSSPSPLPLRGRYPNQRLKTSTQQYVNKMAELREVTMCRGVGLVPRELPIYSLMETLDIVISAEHCHNCTHHTTTLRHKASEYVSHATIALQHLTHIVHSLRPCARVGVVRFSIADPGRLGALEVQVAFRNSRGDILKKVIFSKLQAQRWPTKSTLEKRFTSFYHTLGIQQTSDSHGELYDTYSDDVMGRYPVGTGDWSEVPISSPSWSYSPLQQQGTGKEKCNPFPAVQWAFDSRPLQTPSRFETGAEVRVLRVRNKWGGVERYSQRGVVIKLIESQDYWAAMLAIRLRYSGVEIICPSSECIAMNEQDLDSPPELSLLTGVVPHPLRVLLRYMDDTASFSWRVLSPSDRAVKRKNSRTDIYLCRASFFQQIAELAWISIRDRPGRSSDTLRDYYCDDDNLGDVDVQLAYSEQVLDWVFLSYGTLADMRHLTECALVTEDHFASTSTALSITVE
jgi:hypothetical protein